jgi:hypothetical protein
MPRPTSILVLSFFHVFKLSPVNRACHRKESGETQKPPGTHQTNNCAIPDNNEKNPSGMSAAGYPGSPDSAGKDGFVLNEAQPGLATSSQRKTRTRVSFVLCMPI